MMKFLVVLVVLVAVAAAEIESDGKCDPSLGVVENFDIDKYSGTWYEIYRYEMKYQRGGDCVTAQYGIKEGGVSVLNRMVLGGKAFTVMGDAVRQEGANGAGKLQVTFPTFNNTSPYWVLATDYATYALVYVCKDLPEDKKRVTSWVLSRTKTLSPQAVLAMNDKVKTTGGLSWDLYRETNQSDAACATGDSATSELLPGVLPGSPAFLAALGKPSKAAAFSAVPAGQAAEKAAAPVTPTSPPTTTVPPGHRCNTSPVPKTSPPPPEVTTEAQPADASTAAPVAATTAAPVAASTVTLVAASTAATAGASSPAPVVASSADVSPAAPVAISPAVPVAVSPAAPVAVSPAGPVAADKPSDRVTFVAVAPDGLMASITVPAENAAEQRGKIAAAAAATLTHVQNHH